MAACAFTLVYAFIVSYLLLRGISLFLPLVPPVNIVEAGLDKTIHGEHAYDSDHIVSSGLPVHPLESFYVAGETSPAHSPVAALRGASSTAAIDQENEFVKLRKDIAQVRKMVMQLQNERNRDSSRANVHSQSVETEEKDAMLQTYYDKMSALAEQSIDGAMALDAGFGTALTYKSGESNSSTNDELCHPSLPGTSLLAWNDDSKTEDVGMTDRCNASGKEDADEIALQPQRVS